METLADYHIENEVALRPPRPAKLGAGTNALLGVALLMFALCCYGGVRTLAEAARLGWIAAAGQLSTATVDSIETSAPTGAEQSPEQTAIHYHYQLPYGADHSLQLGVTRLSRMRTTSPVPEASSTPIFTVGQTLPLRCVPWRGGTVAVLWPPQAGQHIGVLAGCGGVITLVSILLIVRLLKWQKKRLRLLRHGIAAVGTITEKKTQTEDAVRYFVRYGYSREMDDAAPHISEHEEQVTAEQWKRLEVGQPVTVLYDPALQNSAGLYLFLRSQ